MSTAASKIGWGILSTGDMASVFTADLRLLADEARIVAVASRSGSKAERFAREHGIPRAYGSYAELAADPEIDVVYVASTHNDHFSSARLCLEAGKAVLVEKPLTTSADDTAALVRLARKRSLFLMEALWTRTNPLVRRAAELAASGELGPIRHVAATAGFAFEGGADHRLLDPAQAGGAILDLGVYPVHLTNLFLGEPETVLGWGYRTHTGVDAHAAATLSYPNATASVACSLSVHLPTRLEVFGERGWLSIEPFFLPPRLLVFRDGDEEPEELVTSWPGGGYTFQAQEVMRCLRAGELESPLVPWTDTEAVARSLDTWLACVSEAGQGADR